MDGHHREQDGRRHRWFRFPRTDHAEMIDVVSWIDLHAAAALNVTGENDEELPHLGQRWHETTDFAFFVRKLPTLGLLVDT